MSTPSGWVNPIGQGAQPGRIDMGVDYTGKFNLYAMGAGTITNLYNSGWPGGTFIGLKLDTGQYMYYAENIAVAPNLKIGQRVTAGQQLGTARGSYPYTEIGWAAPPGTGQTMAAAAGEAATGSDPGAKSTAYGVSMSQTIAALGGPAGILTPGGVTGSVQDTTSGGTTLPGCLPLIGMVYYAMVEAQKCKWYVASRQRFNRRSPHERRNRKRRRCTATFAAWRRTRMATHGKTAS